MFDDDADRDFFVKRFGKIVTETGTYCFAWALIPNHFHLLLKTGATPIATVMKRLLTGYAIYYNRRHNRNGHLFQNRYKSILCQEDSYLLELVRYIHLNPVRANLVVDMKELDKYPYSGHSVLMGNMISAWQDTNFILGIFGPKISIAKRRYWEFVRKGIDAGKRQDLTGGGLIRSAGGWSALKSLRKTGALQKGDERILGDSEFVEKALENSNEKYERRYRLKARGFDVKKVAERVAQVMEIDPDQVWTGGKQHKIVRARSLLCYWATKELGVSQVWLSRKLGISQAAVSLSVARGLQIVKRRQFQIENL